MTQLDGLRVIAVGCVMIGHWVSVNHFLFLRSLGQAGVNLFFTLSGFLIIGILLRNKQNKTSSKRFILKRFYIRRFLRIFPLFYLVLFSGLVFNIPTARQFFAWHLTYTVNYIIGLNKGQGGEFQHLWSLAVEEQFYLIFPILILLVPFKHMKKLFYGLVIFSVLLRMLTFILSPDYIMAVWISYTFTPACFDAFAIGGLLAYMNMFEKKRLESILSKDILFAICLFFNILLCQVWAIDGYSNPIKTAFYTVIFRFSISCFSFWLIGKAANKDFGGWFGKLLENNWVINLGKITYGIYVYHYFMPYIFKTVGLPDIKVVKVLYPVVTVIMASVSWFLFEKPINNLKRYYEYKS